MVVRPWTERMVAMQRSELFWNSKKFHENIGIITCTDEDPRQCKCEGLCPCHDSDDRADEAKKMRQDKAAAVRAADIAAGRRKS